MQYMSAEPALRVCVVHKVNRVFKAELADYKLTFGVIAGLKHVQLMGVVGKGEDFDHWVQDHHNPENKGDQHTGYN